MKPATTDTTRSDLLADIAARLTSQEAARIGAEAVGQLVTGYYRHASVEDLTEREIADLGGTVDEHLRLAQSRQPGHGLVRVLTPKTTDEGWSAAGRTVVEIVTDDMPFLVDSVTMMLEQARLGVHRVLHPQFWVHRDDTGSITGLNTVSGAQVPDTTSNSVGRESWIHIEIDRVDEVTAETIRARLEDVLADVRVAVEDWVPMRDRLTGVVDQIAQDPPPLPEAELRGGAEFLTWLADHHFTFLGSREYRLVRDGAEETLVAVPGTGLGLLRQDPTTPRVLPPRGAIKAREKALLVLAKANSVATVHRPLHLDYIGVKTFDAAGEVTGEIRFLGLFSTSAYSQSVTRIPLLREKAHAVMAAAGFAPGSHTGKLLVEVLETFPRDELFQSEVDDLVHITTAVVNIRERRQLKLFLRRDAYGRFWSVLVYLPKDRYNTTVRQRIADILTEDLSGDADMLEYSAYVGDTFTARLHFVVRPAPGVDLVEAEAAALEARCIAATRPWYDDFVTTLFADPDRSDDAGLVHRYAASFPEAYKEDFSAATGAADIARIEGIEGEEGVALHLYELHDGPATDARLKVYRTGGPLSLSRVLPVLSSLGVEVVDERPYTLVGLDRPTYLYDFGLRYVTDFPEGAKQLFEDAFMAVWEGRSEVDGFNSLVLDAAIDWRSVALLRGYARHMRQGGSPFAQRTIEEALRTNIAIARLIIDLFEARFHPETHGAELEQRIVAAITTALDEVASLDHDRIIRAYLTVITATQRTNFYQVDADGAPHPYVALKLDPTAIPELPEPRPRYEIFVHSPSVEGVHLRFGAVARGGLRWSDRRDDFRAEVLGLVKAQMVKNAVIVPAGAKGGFYAKRLPDPADRDAWLAAGLDSYRTFIRGMLDITDNLVDGAVVPPSRVVRHDGDDPYLVVAADKGTASFSDTANGIAQEYGFWLGDAFASGGSVGYDHKAMGITARGAWISVERHFREMGRDPRTEEFTCVGIGDMSGDVFGNGMLRSEHTRLVAAFDHRDIFLDPDPDPATAFAERKRLFDLPRSSWQDYDTSLISAGGGVYSRTAKAVPVSDEVRRVLGIDPGIRSLTPIEMIRAILLAPVDMLWNGGIGTYVKASHETHAEVADKANDPIRIDGSQLRVRCVGEGGNLGFTQAGRIEYARVGNAGLGGRINADFIDNSAGVDTSDHEVNIKILLDRLVTDGQLQAAERNALLAAMTDDVADLVLGNNYRQNLALADAVANARTLHAVHEDWMATLEERGAVDRTLDVLPSRSEMIQRRDRGEALTAPELAMLMATTKIALADVLVETDVADDPLLQRRLYDYFPSAMRDTYRDQIAGHRLGREIVVTEAVNDLVNNAGTTYWHRMAGETAASVADLTRAHALADELYGAADLRRRIQDLDNQVDAAVQTRLRYEIRSLVERAARWLVSNRRNPLDTAAILAEFDDTVPELVGRLPDVLPGQEQVMVAERRDGFIAAGVPADLAATIALCRPAHAALGIIGAANRFDHAPVDVARAHFLLGERLGLPALMNRILTLPRDDRWQGMARAALRDDIYAVHGQLTAQALVAAAASADSTTPIDPVTAVTAWLDEEAVSVSYATSRFEAICADDPADLAKMSVALRTARSLLNG